MYFLTPPVRFPCYIVYHNFVLLAMTRKTIPPTAYNEPTLIISSLTQLIILKNENKSFEFSTALCLTNSREVKSLVSISSPQLLQSSSLNMTWRNVLFSVSHRTATGLSRISTDWGRSLPDIYVEAKLNHSHKSNTGNRLPLGVEKFS